MRTRFLAASLAVLVLGFTSAAPAQEAAPIDFSAFGQRITDLERRVAALELTTRAAACPLGCDCTTSSVVPATPKAAVPAPVSARAPLDHTHTCPRCHRTWGHSEDGGSHRCPSCGTSQFVQDSPGSRSPASPSYALTTGYASGGCANGACGATTQYQYSRPARAGLFGGGGLFRR